MTTTPLATPTVMPLVDRVRATRLPPPAQRRSIRLAVGVSLREMSAELGVSKLTVSHWERGMREPRRDHALRYRRLLDALQGLAQE